MQTDTCKPMQHHDNKSKKKNHADGDKSLTNPLTKWRRSRSAIETSLSKILNKAYRTQFIKEKSTVQTVSTSYVFNLNIKMLVGCTKFERGVFLTE